MNTVTLKGRQCFIDARIDATKIFLDNNISWHFDYFRDRDKIDEKQMDLMEWALKHAQPTGYYD